MRLTLFVVLYLGIDLLLYWMVCLVFAALLVYLLCCAYLIAVVNWFGGCVLACCFCCLGVFGVVFVVLIVWLCYCLRHALVVVGYFLFVVLLVSFLGFVAVCYFCLVWARGFRLLCVLTLLEYVLCWHCVMVVLHACFACRGFWFVCVFGFGVGCWVCVFNGICCLFCFVCFAWVFMPVVFNDCRLWVILLIIRSLTGFTWLLNF